jgi:hypothetical protein
MSQRCILFSNYVLIHLYQLIEILDFLLMENQDFDSTNIFIEFAHMEHWMDFAMRKLLLQYFLSTL